MMVIMWSPADVIENRVKFNYFLVRIYLSIIVFIAIHREEMPEGIFR